MENDDLCKINSIGDIILETNTSCRLILKNVRHVHDICLNLIWAGKLVDKSYVSKFGNGKWKLFKGSLAIAYGNMQGILYKTQAKLCKGEANIANESSTDLWHQRLRHMSEK